MEGGGLGIDPKILIGNIATFVILAVILKKYAYRPFLAVLEKRRREIESGVAKAQEAEKSLAKIRVLGEEIKSAGEKKAKETVAAAEIKAREKAAQILAAAEEEKKTALANARAAMEKEAADARARRQEEALAVALAVSEKFLAQKITKDQDKKLIERLAQEL
ncbi:MAG TPA: F0F1 ATP synthase subunit B, partial [Candidatus Pacearchaeota archaeon]|jgi:F-type H+-transporting ATPase subunit b|nr:MAG: hypothetical protein YFSK_6660 [Candidatus Yanofskybacteria bacterium]HPO06668.1 F0F1 ATP synthase subunit B [Candidatus Pacearchaeota archaeon]